MITRKFLVTVNRVFEKIMLKPGIEKGIENFYNEYYKYNFTPNGKVLLISIRNYGLIVCRTGRESGKEMIWTDYHYKISMQNLNIFLAQKILMCL